MKGRKIDSLQALRAFAAISVMFFHGTEVLYEQLGYVFLNNFFMAGFSGVQLFFVLSGFIIFYTSYSKSLSVKEFLIKRIIRIYPVHTLIITSLVVLYFISPTKDQAYRGDLGAIVSSLTLIPFDQMVLGPSWTLCFEMFFYLFFALTFLRNKRLFITAIICWVILILIAYVFNFKTGVTAIDNIYDTINFNFIFGCLVAWIYISKPNIKYSNWFIYPAILLFFTFWVLQVNGLLGGGIEARVIYFGIPSALVVLGLLYSRIKVPKILIHLGDASFSLYLLHFLLIRILLKIFLKLHINNYTNNFVTAAGIFILTLIISSIFYLYVETTLTRVANSYVKNKKS